MKKDWVEVFVTYDPVEAEMVKDLLESGGVPAVVRSSKVTPYPVNVGRMGEMKVFVRAADEAAALEAISAFQKGPP